MPIVFVVVGCLLLLLVFNIIVVPNIFFKLLFEIYLFFVLLSYYVKYDHVNFVYFNWFQVCLVIGLIIFGIKTLKPEMLFCIFTICVSVAIYLLGTFDILQPQVLKSLIMLFTVVFSLKYSSLFSVSFVTAINATILESVYAIIEYDKYTFAIFDTNFIFELLVTSCVLYFINELLVKLINYKEKCYDKKITVSFDYDVDLYSVK